MWQRLSGLGGFWKGPPWCLQNLPHLGSQRANPPGSPLSVRTKLTTPLWRSVGEQPPGPLSPALLQAAEALAPSRPGRP